MKIAYSLMACFCAVGTVLFLTASFAVFNKDAFAYIDHRALMFFLSTSAVLGALSWLCFAKARIAR